MIANLLLFLISYFIFSANDSMTINNEHIDYVGKFPVASLVFPEASALIDKRQ